MNYHDLTEKDKTRFWAKVAKTDQCWNWTASQMSGYGWFAIKRSRQVQCFYAHRLSWSLTNGDIPTNQCVLHSCDNRLCVNPDHLFLGTIRDNMKDKVYKGRHVRGSQVSSSKLNETQVVEILAQRPTTTIARLASEYRVCRHTIINICKRRAWKHVAEPPKP